MSLLAIPKTYQNGQVLLESDLDGFRDSITEFINSTKLDGDNIQDDIGESPLIPALAITEVKFSDGSITPAKLSPLNTQSGSDSGLFSTASLTPDQITGAAITLTTVGRPVLLRCLAAPSPSVWHYRTYSSGGSIGGMDSLYFFATCHLFRNGTEIASTNLLTNQPSSVYETIFFVDTPAAGTYLYELRAQSGDGSDARFFNMRIQAAEIT